MPETDNNIVGVTGELPSGFFCLNYFEDLLKDLHKLACDENEWVGGTKGLANLMEMAPYLRVILEDYRQLVERWLHGDNEPEKQQAKRLDKQLLDVVKVVFGETFRDERNAHGAFLVQLKELLREHKGKYVLLAPDTQGIYDVREIASDPGEFERPEVRECWESRRCFVRKIIEGAEKVPEFVLPTPE